MTRTAHIANAKGVSHTGAGVRTSNIGAAPEFSQTPTAAESTRKVVQLASLLGSAQSVDIVHGEQTYRLQITKAGKLILTK